MKDMRVAERCPRPFAYPHWPTSRLVGAVSQEKNERRRIKEQREEKNAQRSARCNGI